MSMSFINSPLNVQYNIIQMFKGKSLINRKIGTSLYNVFYLFQLFSLQSKHQPSWNILLYTCIVYMYII